MELIDLIYRVCSLSGFVHKIDQKIRLCLLWADVCAVCFSHTVVHWIDQFGICSWAFLRILTIFRHYFTRYIKTSIAVKLVICVSFDVEIISTKFEWKINGIDLIWKFKKKKKHPITTKWRTNRWTLAIGHTVVELTKNWTVTHLKEFITGNMIRTFSFE